VIAAAWRMAEYPGDYAIDDVLRAWASLIDDPSSEKERERLAALCDRRLGERYRRGEDAC
jgi:hypothetical protein